jgi:hypothetical protein
MFPHRGHVSAWLLTSPEVSRGVPDITLGTCQSMSLKDETNLSELEHFAQLGSALFHGPVT